MMSFPNLWGCGLFVGCGGVVVFFIIIIISALGFFIVGFGFFF